MWVRSSRLFPRTACRNWRETKRARAPSRDENCPCNDALLITLHRSQFSNFLPGIRYIRWVSSDRRRVYTNIPFFLGVVGIVPKCFPIGLFVSYVGSESRESSFAAQVVIPMWKTWCHASVRSFTGLRSFWCIFGPHLVADLSASEYSCEVLVISAFLHTKTFLLADKSATENILSRHHRKCYMYYTYVGTVRLTFLAKLI